MFSTRRIHVLLPALILLVGLSSSLAADEPVKSIVERGVVYAKAGERELKLDIARPEGDGPFPALVFIHGGGWRGGKREDFFPFVSLAAQRGYVAATVSYRLTDPDADGKAANPFPSAIHDVKAAVRWLRAHASDWRIDPDRIGVAGGSAGGHLALLVGLTDEKSGLEGDLGHAQHSSRVRAVVNYFGPTDMVRGYETTIPQGRELITSFLNGTPDEQPANYKQASPVTWISPDDPPILTFHGGKDTLVPTEQARILDERLKAAELDHTLVIFDDQGHGFRADLMLISVDKMFSFFDEHLKSNSVKE